MIATERHLLIPKIESGVVIDHIPAGLGLTLLEIMQAHMDLRSIPVSVGFNYDSTRLGHKDIIKVQADDLPQVVLNLISLVSPGVTIKRVRNFTVDKKYPLLPAQELENVVKCINPKCITNHSAPSHTHFRAVDGDAFRCSYCERVFRLKDLSRPVVDAFRKRKKSHG